MLSRTALHTISTRAAGAAFLLALCTLGSSCGVGGLVGGAAGAVILTADRDSSDSPTRVELDPAPTRDALRRDGDPATVVVRYRETRSRSRRVTLEYVREDAIAPGGPPAWAAASFDAMPDPGAVKWDAQTDLVGLDLHRDAVAVRVRVFSGGRSADASESDAFAVGNTRPRVAFEFPPPPDGEPPEDELVVGGNVNIVFRASDAEDDPLVGTEVYFEVDGVLAPIEPEPEPFDEEIEATPRGQVHFRLWSSRRDVPDRRVGGVVLVVRARDAFGNLVEARTAPFVVDNNDEPEAELLFLDSETRDLSFEVPLHFRLVDANSSPTDVVVQYATERDAFPALPPDLLDRDFRRALLEAPELAAERAALRIATPSDRAPGRDATRHVCEGEIDKILPACRVCSLDATPEGSVHLFLWNAAVDLPPRQTTAVFIRVTPYDDERGTSDTTQTSFAIDNDIFRDADGLRLGSGDARAIAAADVDGDGLEDVAIALESSVAVYLREADGGAGFAPGPDIYGATTLQNPRHVAIADVTSNGAPDLIVVDRPYGLSRDMLIVFPDFDPLASSTRFELDAEVVDLLAADLDGFESVYVGKSAEIVVATSQRDIVVLDASTTASIRERQRIRLSSEPLDLAHGDFNGDGREDVVVVRDQDIDGAVVTLFMGGASAPVLELWQELTPDSFPIVGEPLSAGVGDFDGDAFPDLAVGFDPGALFLFTNTLDIPGGDLATPPLAVAHDCRVPLFGVPSALVVGDVTNDGELDFVALSRDDDFQYELVARGAACEWRTFKRITVDENRAAVRPAAVLDMNGDGRADLAMTTPDGALLVPQSSAGTVIPRSTETLDPRPGTVFRDVRIADVDRDLLPDVVGLSFDGDGDEGAVAIFFQDRLGRFPSRPNLELVTSSSPGSFASNLDRSGSAAAREAATVFAVARIGGLDVFVSGRFGDGVSFARTEVEDVDRDIPAGPLLVGDYGGSGEVDIVRLDRLTSTLVLYEVDTGPVSAGSNAVVATSGAFAVQRSPRELVSGDFDCDGRLDVATFHAGGNVNVYLQRPGPPEERFTLASTIATGSFSGRFEAADFDRDGRLDLLIVASTINTLIVALQGDDGDFTPPFTSLPGEPGAPRWFRPAICDFNGDDAPDFVLSDFDRSQLSFFFQGRGDDGTSTGFEARPSFRVDLDESFAGGARVVCRDLSGDGRPEILVVRPDGGRVAVFRAR